jgi:hypothetical protein
MSEGKPEFLVQGAVARLIPVCAASQRERAACSVLLAALRVVHPFARDLLSEMGKRVGNWASIEAYTEVVFQNQPDGTCRPDGLIIFDTVRRQWKALVEAKLGQGRISPEQIKRYYRLARANDIDAIITISNELNARPQHIPYDVPDEVLGNIELYHWSWPHLGMVADMLLREEEDFDEEQHFILEEVVRYLESETTEGGFQQMGSDWPHLNQKIFSNGPVSGNDLDVLSAIKNWHQQQSSICAWLGRELQRHVSLRLSRGHRESQSMRVFQDAEEFVATRQLSASLHSSALAGPISVVADALRRNVTCSCSIGAPQDRRRYQTRIDWLLEQLPDSNLGDTMVHIAWDNGQRTCVALRRLKRDANEGRVEGALPVAFELSRSVDLGQSFGGPRLFVQGVDNAVWSFCDSIARHLRAWQPRPVRVEQPERAETEAQSPEKVVIQEAAIPGGIVKIFDDSSIELQTAEGSNWFANFPELERSLRAKERLKSREANDSDANGGGGDADATRPTDEQSSEIALGSAPSKEAEPNRTPVSPQNPGGSREEADPIQNAPDEDASDRHRRELH